MKRIVIIITLINFLILHAFAQTRITGTVVDAAGLEMIGSSIIQKGTTNGVITDINGEFTINLLPNAEKVLVISSVGYVKQEVDVSSRTNINVILQEDQIALEEVVVVGYGTQKKVSITGSISNVSSKDLTDVPVTSVSNALTGRVSGLVTRQISGRPGGDAAQLFIRGQASFNTTAPLILVDGVERSFNQIDSEDIESISVLKDASATAVYGVRGANGVILVTTKRGDEGKSKISLSSEYGITHFTAIPQQLNAENTARLQREGSYNDGLDITTSGNTNNFPASEYDMYLYRTQLKPFTHPDNDLVDIFTKPGSRQRYNLNISGGNKVLKYFVGLGYLEQTGMYQTDVEELRKHPTFAKLISLSPEVDKALVNPDYNPEYLYRRITARTNLDININDDFSIGIDMSYRFGNQNRPAAYSIIDANSDGENMRLFAMFIRNPPQAFPLIHASGAMSSAHTRWRQNPLITLAYTGYRNDTDNDMELTAKFQYNLRKLLKGLSIDGKYAFDNSWGNFRGMGWRPFVYSYDEATNAYTQGLNGFLPKTESSKSSPISREYAELAVRYNNTFNSVHKISGVVLTNFRSSKARSGQYSYVPHVYQALIGRVNYEYDERYLIEFNMGYNGSNRFAEGHRYDFFPAVSAGWVPTNESFFPKNNILNFAKLRASAGQVGNDNIGGFSYYYRSSYENTNNTKYSFGVTHNPYINGLIEGTLPNELITWETATKYNVGFDSQWFKSRLSFNLDFFQELRSNILTNPGRFIVAAGTVGLPPSNLGIVENKGFETELGWSDKIGQFQYFAKGMFAFARNEIIERSEEAQPYDYLYRKGNPIGQFYGYQFMGFFQSVEEIAAAPQQFGLTNVVPGDMRYKDINGDGVIDQNDETPIGYSTVPEITFSGQFGFSYKNFDISLMLQGATNVTVNPTNEVGWDNRFGAFFEEHLNRWTPETASTATYPLLRKASLPNTNNYYTSTFWLKDGSYLRLKNLQFGYAIPKKALRKTPLNSIRLYANGFNLFTLTEVTYVDPEMDPNQSNGFYYPQQKVFNVGINVTF
ncbi:MAG: vitamin B12/cobalamin outer membrane transporter [Bacteroidetes bacterium ADurb.Bin174]|nr:MAG: vitamin B12/cobalamin outer membrane transporter [Bacteroidetes bacterium ADurb.Bin174]